MEANSKPQPPVATNGLVKLATRWATNYLAPVLDDRIRASTTPFNEPELLLPHDKSRLWGWTHYGIFLPSIPAPYRFLNTMTLIGATGAQAFDDDYVAAADVRNTSTVMSCTAFGDEHHYEAYDTSSNCEMADDGSRIAWGDDLVITSNYPDFTVTGRYHHMSVDLDIKARPQVAWFIKSPVYHHFSLLATCTGTIKDIRGTTNFSEMCTVEYARCVSPQVLTARPLAPTLKLPITFFSYQVVNLDAETQLLLSEARTYGTPLCRMAHIRSLRGTAQVFQQVSLEILAYQDKLAVDRHGRTMKVPDRMHWTIKEGGQTILELTAKVDAPLRFGLGKGYSSAYSYTGTWEERSIQGSAYLEWVNFE